MGPQLRRLCAADPASCPLPRRRHWPRRQGRHAGGRSARALGRHSDRARAGERGISEEVSMLERRSFLTGAAALAALAPLASTAFAAAPTDRRFVLVLLRGGLDGLHALPPHGDRDYRRL